MPANEKHHPKGNKIKYVYFLLLLVTFITIFSFSADVTQNSPEFCVTCHTMKPEYYTWKVSSHSQMGCIECHTEGGVEGVYNFAKDMTRRTYSEITKSYVLPIRLFRGVDDDICLRCHSYNRQASVPGNLIIPHEQHTDKRVRCASCHSAIAHGDIARRAVTRKVDFTAWDTDAGLQEMARELVQPSMDNCMSCHFRRKVSTDCVICHTDMTGPDNHFEENFSETHGIYAQSDLADCNFCHGYNGPKKMQVKENTSVTAYSRENRFCISCHRQKPDSHSGGTFKTTHGNLLAVQGKSQNNCLTCHDNNVTSDMPKITEISCSSCHPSRHGSGWRVAHFPRLLPGQELSSYCLTCHSEPTCLACHDLPWYLPADSGVPAIDNFSELPEFQN
jgi:nitrate/TMAO reductase-like tetraheme cytochrome c subunit